MGQSGLLDGRYKLLRVIGSGSEGYVYLSFQESTFRFFAVKEVRKEGECYSREGTEVWKRMNNPGLPSVFDVIETEEAVWIVMEYMEGLNLKQWSSRYGIPDGILLYRWCFSLCRTLQYLHEQNPPVIFGDLKPDNIVLQKNMPILTDCGSMYVMGSRTRKTGTAEYQTSAERLAADPAAGPIEGDILGFGKTVEKLLPEKKNGRWEHGMLKEWRRFVELAVIPEEKKHFGSMKECRRFLLRMGIKRITDICVLLLSLLFLFTVSHHLFQVQEKKIRESSYEEQMQIFLEKLEQEREKEDHSGILRLISDYPQEKEGYLELLHKDSADLEFSIEEQREFEQIWNEADEKDVSYGAYLQKDPEGYAEVIYEAGLCNWYFSSERDHMKEAAKWFEKLNELADQTGAGQELFQKSRVYLQLEEWCASAKRYQMTGENPEFFTEYLSKLRELEEGEEQDSYYHLMMKKEEGLFLIRYMAELKQGRMKREETESLRKEIQEEANKNRNQGQMLDRLAQELDRLVPVIREMEEQIYGGPDNGKE